MINNLIDDYRQSIERIEQAKAASAEAWEAITSSLLAPMTTILWKGAPAMVHAWRYENGTVVLDVRESKTQLRYIERGAVVDLSDYLALSPAQENAQSPDNDDEPNPIIETTVDENAQQEIFSADADDFNEFPEEVVESESADGGISVAERRQPMAIANTNKFARSVEDGQLKRLSDSGVKAWLTCPAMWAFQYLEGIKQPSNGYFIRGRVVHDTLAFLTGEYLRTGELKSAEQIERLIADNFTDSVQSAAKNGIDWERLGRDDALMQTKNAIKSIITSPWYLDLPKHNVGHIEYDGIIDLGEVLYSCRPDIVVDDCVVDFKVANSSPNYGKIDPSHIIQNVAYCSGLGLNKTYNLYSVVGTKEPKLVITPPVSFEDSDIMRFRNMINAIAIQIKNSLSARSFPATGAYTVEYGKNACVDCHYGKTGICDKALPYGGK